MEKIIRNVIIFAAVILVVIIATFSMRNVLTGNTGASTATDSSSPSSTTAVTNNLATGTTGAGGTTGTTDGNVQIVKLSVKGNNYVLEPSTLKKGVPVRMIADVANMPGCSKGFTIPDFGISKSVSAGDNIIEFTPDKIGTFGMACFMNMYRGTFSVTDDGSAPTGAAAQQAAQVKANVASKPAGTCGGSSGGGCGCGG